MVIFDMEVDVVVQRPPTPSNTRTIFASVAVPDQPGADTEARVIAAQMGCCHGVMVTAVRIIHINI